MAEEEVIKTYNLHANCYVAKPVDLEQFVKTVKSVNKFLFEMVTLPTKEAELA